MDGNGHGRTTTRSCREYSHFVPEINRRKDKSRTVFETTATQDVLRLLSPEFRYNRNQMRQILALFALAASVAAAADFERPYEKGQGWKPLLTGTGLSGWLSRENKLNEWFTSPDAAMSPANPNALEAKKGPGPDIVNSLTGKANDIYTEKKFGDLEIYVEWMIPKGSNSGVYLQGLYEIQIFDSYGVPHPNESHAGGIYHQWINDKPVGGASPRLNASRPAGEWQYFHAWFRAPRFDKNGKKTADAKFVKVIYNGQVVHENVTIAGPTRAHMEIPEAPLNPIMLQGDHGPVAFRNIYVRSLDLK
jgi:hypothetical protein